MNFHNRDEEKESLQCGNFILKLWSTIYVGRFFNHQRELLALINYSACSMDLFVQTLHECIINRWNISKEHAVVLEKIKLNKKFQIFTF